MFHFREPTGGVTAALEMIDSIAAAGLPSAHVGLHTGPVVFQGGDYFGRTVNLAARIGEQAAPARCSSRKRSWIAWSRMGSPSSRSARSS
jgi:class 3 adenylate cyclase